MAHRACCRGQAVRGWRDVIVSRRVGAVRGSGVVWGDLLQVDSHHGILKAAGGSSCTAGGGVQRAIDLSPIVNE